MVVGIAGSPFQAVKIVTVRNLEGSLWSVLPHVAALDRYAEAFDMLGQFMERGDHAAQVIGHGVHPGLKIRLCCEFAAADLNG
jgi:hypothetical protein